MGIGLDAVSDRAAMATSVAQDPSRWPPDELYELETMESCEPEQIPKLCERMVAAGYGDEAIRAVLGDNWLRLAREVWKAPSRRTTRTRLAKLVARGLV